MDNNFVKYYPDWTSGYEVMAQTRSEQTDRQTVRQMDRQGDSYIPRKLSLWGSIIISYVNKT